MSALLREPILIEPTHHPMDPATCRVCCPLPRSGLRKQTSDVAPERRPDAAPSVMPPGSPRPVHPHADNPIVLSAVSACRRFSDQGSPPTTLGKIPSMFQAACRCTESHFRNAPQEIDRDVVSAPVRESASLDTRPITGDATPSKEPGISPGNRTPDSRHNPEDGICRRETNVLYEISPVPFPNEEPPAECSRILPPGVSNAPLSSSPTAEHFERLPITVYPAAAR